MVPTKSTMVRLERGIDAFLAGNQQVRVKAGNPERPSVSVGAPVALNEFGSNASIK